MSELLDAARKAYNTEDASVYAEAEAENKHAAVNNKHAPKKLTDKQISEMVSLCHPLRGGVSRNENITRSQLESAMSPPAWGCE